MELYVCFYSLSTNIFGFIHKTFGGTNGYLSPEDEESSSGNKIKMRLQEFQRRYHPCSEIEDILNVCLHYSNF